MRLLKGMEGVDLAEHRWVALCKARLHRFTHATTNRRAAATMIPHPHAAIPHAPQACWTHARTSRRTGVWQGFSEERLS